MNMTEIKSARAGDSYYKIMHSSGLTVYVYPKEGYQSAYAIIGTKYGSINNCFSVDGGEKIRSPTESPTTSSTNFSRVPRATPLHAMPKREPALTPTPALKRPVICSHAPIVLTRA